MNSIFPKSILVSMVGCLSARLWAANGVAVSENEANFALSNGILTAMVSKRSGDLTSLKYKGQEVLDADSGHPAGYWSHDVSRGERVTRVTIDPKRNGGERGEVSVKGISNGRLMGSGPGGSVVADIEIRYALGRDDSSLYAYCIFSHPTNYPATAVGEGRFCVKLNDSLFDWMTVDKDRNLRAITAYDWNHGEVLNMKEARRMTTGQYQGRVEHKYDYSANQFDTRAWGWCSSDKHIGVWFVNPTIEYLSGGPTKVELTAHRDATFGRNPDAAAAPCLLNYWRSSHYGGSVCAIGAGEPWTKIVGPFLIYCNSASNHAAMWKDALERANREAKAWPYEWVEGVDYPHRRERSMVEGRLAISDAQAPASQISNLLVGLTARDYVIARTGRTRAALSFAGGGEDDVTNREDSGNLESRIVSWQNDAKHYQFWAKADTRGRFAIPNVRAGNYTLHAIADGVLGEFVLTNVAVAAGKMVDLGRLNWRPIRFGRQLWDIGIPDRKGSEFFKGDDYFHWGWYLEYPKLFPGDVHFVIGKSDFRRDWFFEQVPHSENSGDTSGRGVGRSTAWTIHFSENKPQQGKATLRLAICGCGTRSITVGLNDQIAGIVTNLPYNATINRDGISGTWFERDVVFDASLIRAGQNVIKLTIPAGNLTSGVIYDYLRLEVE